MRGVSWQHDSSPETPMVLPCDNCSAVVDAQELADYSLEIPSGDRYRVAFHRCPRCEHPLLTLQEWEWDGHLGEPSRVYPPHGDTISSTLPAPLRSAFDEAVTCYRSKAFTAAAVMCRKTLEGICKERGITERNLATALTKLRDAGTIDARLFEWADQLRLFGNDAAHDLSVTIEGPDARDIIDFTKALIEYVFTFQERFLAFKARRSKQAAS